MDYEIKEKKSNGIFKRIYGLIKLIIFLSIALIVVTVVSTLFYVGSRNSAIVTIDQGMSTKAVARRFEESGVLKAPKIFSVYVELMGWSKKIRAGRYDVKKGTTPAMLARMMFLGEVLNYSFTVVEGWTIQDISSALENQPFLGNEKIPQEYSTLARDPSYISGLGFSDIKSLEGYLFPDTYAFSVLDNSKMLIDMQVKKFKSVFDDTAKQKASALGFSMHQIITIASLIEKETGLLEEMPLVSGVIYNRLKKNMLLQIDPTVIYGMPNFNGNITKSDLMNPHPYNTYVHAGLPPGPICNPGKTAIYAALNPANVDYLYFVSRKDGSHEFTSNLTDHMRAVVRYQLSGGK